MDKNKLREKSCGLYRVIITAALVLLLSAVMKMNASAYRYTTRTEAFRANGREYVMVTLSDSNNGGDQYSALCEVKNGLYVPVAKISLIENYQYWNAPVYVCSYNGTLYFNMRYDNNVKLVTYKPGQSSFQKEANINIYAAKGKYAYGATSMPTDIGAASLCTYNLKTGKLKRIGRGYFGKVMGGKVYYTQITSVKNTRYVKASIIRREFSGAKKKTLKTIKDRHGIYSVTIHNRHKMSYLQQDYPNFTGRKSVKY